MLDRGRCATIHCWGLAAGESCRYFRDLRSVTDIESAVALLSLEDLARFGVDSPILTRRAGTSSLRRMWAQLASMLRVKCTRNL